MSLTPRSADPRLQAFRDEIRAIVALSGGINAVSMGKIRHRGQAAGLEPEEVDGLVAELRSGDREEPKNLVAFRKAVRSILKKSHLKPGDVLTPRLVRKLEETGVSRFRLTRSDSARMVQDQAREFDLKRLSPEVAIETFRQQVRTMRDSGPLTPSRMKVLRKFADTLGVDAPQFEILVREEVRTALAHPVEVRRANRRFLGSVISAGLLVVLSFFLAMSFFRSKGTPPAPSTLTGNQPQVSSTDPVKPQTPPDPDDPAPEAPREPALVLARRAFPAPADQAILDGLTSSKEADRIGAMRSLLLRLDRHRETPEQAQALERLMSSILATDPSPSLVTMTLQELRDHLNLIGANQVLSAYLVETGFWTLDTLLEALVEPGLKAERASILAREIDEVLGAGSTQALLASSAKEAPREAHGIRARYARALYQKLNSDAGRDATQATYPEAEIALFRRTSGVLSDDERTTLRASFLSAALEPSGHVWDRYLEPVGHVLDQGSSRDIETILDIYLKTQNVLLQQALDQELRKRVDDATGLASLADVAEAFRLRARSGGSRRAVLEERAQASIDRSRASKGPSEAMRQVVDLALSSTLACALDQGEASFPDFDALLKGPPKVDRPATTAVAQAPAPIPPATFFRGPGLMPPVVLDQAIAGLGANSPFERIEACRSLARQVIPDNLPDPQAYAIARYVLWGGKTRDEDAATGSYLIPLTKPASVRLAMADAIGDVRPLSRRFRMIDASAAERMLISITGEPVKLDGSGWKVEARRILLSLVLTDLDPGLDTSAEQYRLLYQTQGRLLGMPESDALLTARPSQMIEVVTNHLVSTLSKSAEGRSESDRQRLDRVTRDLIAADYLANAEPQRLVLIQRAWVRVLSVYIASRRPEAAEEARTLADELTSQEVHDDDVLEQLKAGERKAIRLWLLLTQVKK